MLFSHPLNLLAYPPLDLCAKCLAAALCNPVTMECIMTGRSDTVDWTELNSLQHVSVSKLVITVEL